MLSDPIETIRREIETWNSPFVELDCFGTADAERIVEIVSEFCLAHLHTCIKGYFFYRVSVGIAHGIQLQDRRQVVIKVRPPPETNPALSLDAKSLDRICTIMNWLADRNYPCPRILAGPAPLARGLATVEELLECGHHGDGFEPEYRRIVATGLADLIELLRFFKQNVCCLKHFQRGDSLPHATSQQVVRLREHRCGRGMDRRICAPAALKVTKASR